MRWPLRVQILVPFAVITIVTVVVSSVATVVAYSTRARREIEAQLADVEQMLDDTNFPLTDQVLVQMARLSGAEFVWQQQGRTIASSTQTEFPQTPVTSPESRLRLRDAPTVNVDGIDFFHFVIAMSESQAPETRRGSVHVYLPQQRYFSLLRDIIWTPIILGAISIIVMVAVAARIASRLSESVGKLQQGVGSLVSGDFEPIPVPNRNDEVRDLVIFSNRLADRLRQYDQEVRNQERLQTVGKLGASMAHKLGNSVTGCTLAIDLLNESNDAQRHDAIRVVRRELEVMKRYVDRVLTLGRQSTMEPERLDVRDVVHDVCTAQGPKLDHSHVQLQVIAPDHPVVVRGDPVALQHAVDNLVENAVRAAHAEHPAPRDSDVPCVKVEVSDSGVGIEIHVWDNGAGPSDTIAPHLFEAMASDQPGGTGLGLCLVKQIAREFGGSVHWARVDGHTRFTIGLPRPSDETT